MADYTADYESARADILEDGTKALMSWSTSSQNQTSGVDTPTGDFEEEIAIVVFPIAARGRTFAEMMTFRDKVSFIATPMVSTVTMEKNYKVTIGAKVYEIDTCDALAPDGGQSVAAIIYQGILRPGT